MAEVSFEDAGAGVLVEAAREAARHAHAPYSRFAVGAALLLGDGTIVTGTNFENASYGLSLCAETVALATANAQGRLADVVAVAVIGGMMGPVLSGFTLDAWNPHGALAVLALAYALFIPVCLVRQRAGR